MATVRQSGQTRVIGILSTYLLHELHQLQSHIVKGCSSFPSCLNKFDQYVDRGSVARRGVCQGGDDFPKSRHFVDV